MNVVFPLLLILAVCVTGLIALTDMVLWSRKRKLRGGAMNWMVEYSRSFFPILLIVLVIRSFIFQPYRVPTGSLEPTVVPGDFLAVKQFSYGLRLPISNKKILGVGQPKRGDIAVFMWPPKPTITFVKRVIGLPGDHIQYKNKVLTINGVEAKQEVIGTAFDVESDYMIPVEKRLETINGIQHEIYIRSNAAENENFDLVVPSGNYFMMGDNRDNSGDSRAWGFVPDENLIGQAFVIIMSWDSQQTWLEKIRWQRIGKKIG